MSIAFAKFRKQFHILVCPFLCNFFVVWLISIGWSVRSLWLRFSQNISLIHYRNKSFVLVWNQISSFLRDLLLIVYHKFFVARCFLVLQIWWSIIFHLSQINLRKILDWAYITTKLLICLVHSLLPITSFESFQNFLFAQSLFFLLFR